MIEYAEPLTDIAEGAAQEEIAIETAITFWNLSLMPKQETLKSLKKFITGAVMFANNVGNANKMGANRRA